MRYGLFALLLIIFTVFVSLVAHSIRKPQSHSEPPLLYYYSPAENGLVIEQADGTSHTLLAQDVVPEGHTLIEGPGWSPSGEWFAWTSGFKKWEPNAYKSFPWIMSRDGTRRLTLLDGTGAYGLNLVWSPTSDLLLATIPYDPVSENTYIQLIDPNTEQVLVTYERAADSVWSPNGRHFFFRQDHNPDPNIYEPFLVVASVDGIVSERPLERHAPRSEYRWTPDDRLLYMDSSGQHLILEDVVTHKVTSLALTTSQLKQIDWSPDGQTALIYTGKCDEYCNGTQLWSFSLQSQALNLISDSVHEISFNNPNFASQHRIPSKENWSSDSRKALYWTDKALYYYDFDSQRSIKITDLGEHLYPLKVRWMPDNQSVMLNQDGTLERFSLESAAIQTLIDEVYNYEVSPDGLYIAISSSKACRQQSDCIYTRDGEWLSDIALHSSSWETYSIRFQWHPTEPWLLISDQPDGGAQWFHMMISDLTGTIRRETFFCPIAPACIGWLPPQVEVKAASELDVTVARIPDIEVNMGGVHNDIQWSPDETLIAVGTQILDSQTLKTLHKLPGAVSQLYWKADGSSLLTVWRPIPSQGGNQQYIITLYDTSTWAVTTHVAGEQLLLNDDVIGVLQQETHQVDMFYRDTFEYAASIENVDSVDLSPNNLLATRDILTGRVTLWQINQSGFVSLGEITDELNTKELETLARIPGMYRPTFQAQGRVLAVDRNNNSIEYWDVSTGARVSELPQETPATPPITVDSFVFILRKEDETPIFKIVPQTAQKTIDDLLSNGSVVPLVVYRSHDDTRIVLQHDRDLYVWDGVRDEILLQRNIGYAYTKGTSLPSQPVALDPQGQFLVVSAQIGHWGESAIEVYDLETMEQLDRINRKAYSIYWASDSSHFVAVTRSTLMLINISGK